jgi:ankyrin repeat protein
VDINAKCHATGNRNEGFTALMLAIDREHQDISNLLFDKHADVNLRNANGETALIVAAYSSATNVDHTIEVLLDRGADVDAQDDQGHTALMEAARNHVRDRTGVVRALLEHNASPSKTDVAGLTALHHAARFCPNPQIAMLLLDSGADINVRDLRKRTALMYAARSLNIRVIRLLLERGASVNELDEDHKSALKFAEEYPNAESRADTVRALKAAGAR